MKQGTGNKKNKQNTWKEDQENKDRQESTFKPRKDRKNIDNQGKRSRKTDTTCQEKGTQKEPSSLALQIISSENKTYGEDMKQKRSM